jgi:hypothetical protein
MKRHTVILGAGATIAAIPNGDRNGRKSSVMNGLIEELNLQDVLRGIHLCTESNNLEDIYSELYSRPECREACQELERRLYDYFSSLELPDEPTVYDLLILSLTKKDLIATFNWDPLLIQARERCAQITTNLPEIICLHGNVAIGHCPEHKLYGPKNIICPQCNKPLTPTNLLFPVAKKDYDADSFISASWKDTESYIDHSYMLTIFGYSAPASDMKAVSLLKKAWGDIDNRQLEEVSVIDIIAEDVMLEKWKDFIYSHHYNYTNDFFNSYLGRLPRRSCEATFARLMGGVWLNGNMGFKEGMSWDEIEKLVYELVIEEEMTPEREEYPIHYGAVIG